MLLFLLAGCGLFHPLSELPTNDDTGQTVTETGTTITETGTTITETGLPIPPVEFALYAMTIQDNGPIKIETFDIDAGVRVETSPTSLSGSSEASNGLMLTTDNRLFATGNGDSLIEGFSIDDRTGLLRAEGWSPYQTQDMTLHTISEKDGVVYGIGSNAIGSYQIIQNGQMEELGVWYECGAECLFIDIVATLDGSHFAATGNSIDGTMGTVFTGSLILNDISNMLEDISAPMRNLVASKIDNLVYASSDEGVAAIQAEEGRFTFRGFTGVGGNFTDIAVSRNGDMGYGVASGFGGTASSLQSYIVSQGGMVWQSMESVEAPEDTEYIYVSDRYMALSSRARIWLYELSSNGRPGEHFLEFTRQGQNYFGPIVIVEGAGGN